jgi:dTDP-4-amino-4,6-dideoxygalactose transaminase
LCVHQIGMPCDLRHIVAIAKRHHLPVIEDAACAIGSEMLWKGEWQKIGAPHGDVACFSFHPRKVISTGDGGMITTRHADWDQRFRLLRQHAMSVAASDRHGASQVIFESYPEVGFNYRMTDIQAAVGREQLKRLPAIVQERRSLARQYAELLGDHRDLDLPQEPPWARSNWQSYSVGLPEHADQRAVMQSMLEAGVSTRRGIMCSHLEPAYSDLPQRRALPQSERAQSRRVLLPLFPGMTSEQQVQVATALRQAIDRGCADD